MCVCVRIIIHRNIFQNSFSACRILASDGLGFILILGSGNINISSLSDFILKFLLFVLLLIDILKTSDRV